MRRTRLFATFLISLSLLAAPSFAAVKAGTKCTKAGATSTTGGKKYTCIKSGNKLVWNKGVTIKAATKPDLNPVSKPTNPTPEPTQSATPKPSPDPTIKNIAYEQPSEASDNVELCKIKEVSKSRGMTGAGFPEWVPMTKSTGTVTWALIPIDFPDLPGEANFRTRVDDQMKLLTEWYETVSEGKLKVQWVVMDKWVRLPNPSKDYQIGNSQNLGDVANGSKLWTEAMKSADPLFDFTNIQTVNFILPKGQTFLNETSQGFPWDTAVKNLKTNEGSVASFSIPGVFFDQPGRQYWSYWAHEFGHVIGLPHVGASRGDQPPFNPFDLMGGQDGISRELSGWIRFFARWLPDEKVYCKESAKLKSIDLTLAPLSGSESGLKFAVIPVSATKAVLIESRRVTKFSCGPTKANGVLVYTYDATLGHGDNFLLPVTPSGRPVITQSGTPCAVAPFADPLLYEGDKVSAEGITIEVLMHGNYDRIRISKG